VPIGRYIYNELKQKKDLKIRGLDGPVWMAGDGKLCTLDRHLMHGRFENSETSTAKIQIIVHSF
jgi:hypothetical protein